MKIDNQGTKHKNQKSKEIFVVQCSWNEKKEKRNSTIWLSQEKKSVFIKIFTNNKQLILFFKFQNIILKRVKGLLVLYQGFTYRF